MFFNDGKGPWVEDAAAVGLGGAGDGRAMVTVDVDRDGDLDLFVYGTNRQGYQELHFSRNDGTAAAPSWTHVTANYFGRYKHPVQFADLDGDGEVGGSDLSILSNNFLLGGD